MNGLHRLYVNPAVLERWVFVPPLEEAAGAFLPPAARKTLGASPDSLTSALAPCRKWHPDRNKDNVEKANKKFTEVCASARQ